HLQDTVRYQAQLRQSVSLSASYYPTVSTYVARTRRVRRFTGVSRSASWYTRYSRSTYCSNSGFLLRQWVTSLRAPWPAKIVPARAPLGKSTSIGAKSQFLRCRRQCPRNLSSVSIETRWPSLATYVKVPGCGFSFRESRSCIRALRSVAIRSSSTPFESKSFSLPCAAVRWETARHKSAADKHSSGRMEYQEYDPGGELASRSRAPVALS